MPAIGNGLAFDTTDGTISGTPDAESTAVAYTITAITTGGYLDSATVIITVTATFHSETVTHEGITYKTIKSPHTGRIWLDRDIGAMQVATSSTDVDSYGTYLSFFDAEAACPDLYRLPDRAEWEADDVGITNTRTGFDSFLKLPAAGTKITDNLLHFVGISSYYWSSTRSGIRNKITSFNINADNAVYMGYIPTIDFLSVRCIRKRPVISTSVSTLDAKEGVAITPVTIVLSGGVTVDSYSISPPISNGLAFSTTTGTISGTPDAEATAVTYTITATTATGDSGSTTVIITVLETDSPPTITVSASVVTAIVGEEIAGVTVDSSAGGTVASYSILPNLNADTGLDFNTATGTISGTPTKAISTKNYTITATNAGGMDTASVTITVELPLEPIITASVSTLIATVGAAITPVTITKSGGRVASFSILPAIGNGLAFSTTTGTISGTPDAEATAVAYTITTTNAGGMDTASVTIIVELPLEPIITASVSTLIATVGAAITPVTITSTGGMVTSYRIVPAISNGLAFDTTDGTISGTPDAEATAVAYTITTTNAGGMDTASVTIIVELPLEPIITASVSTLIATVGAAITPVTITSTGGMVASYRISPAISNGLVFDTTTGTISGTPDAEATAVAYTITTTNATGSATASVTIIVELPPEPIITASVSMLTAEVGIAITPVTITSTGGMVTSFSISPAISNGLAFSTTTGTISGTPDAEATAVAYTITTTNAGGMDTASVTIIVELPLEPIITASVSTLIATVGAAITPVTITSTGGMVTSFSISPAISNGLAFSTTDGTISGTPDAEATAVAYTITTTNAGGMATASVTIIVELPLEPIITASVSMLTAEVGIAITPVTITSTGGMVTSFSISPAISNGLAFDTTDGTISGTPDAEATAVAYTITTTNAGGMDTASVTITVELPLEPIITASVSTLIATVGAAITPVTITSTGGMVASYRISPAISNGLVFDTTTGTISGTPDAEATAVAYTITTTNATGSATASVTIIVELPPEPIITASVSMLTAEVGIAITPVTITSTGGMVTSFSISPAISNGLAFSTTTGTISGTPDAEATAVAYTITTTNAGGMDTASVTIIVELPLEPIITASVSTLIATVGAAITPVTITSTGGMVTSFSISPAISNGLVFDTTTGTISGTPDAEATAVAYTITTTNATGSATASVTIIVELPPAPIISASVGTLTATVGIAITPVTITSTGGMVASFSISPAISNGLAFSTTTGTISGTPDAEATAVTYTITATNATGDSGSTTVIITVLETDSPPTITVSASVVTAIVGEEIAGVTVDSSAGGTVASYSILPNLNADTGLDFNTTTGTISGTPTKAISTKDYTITATNVIGTGTAMVTVTVTTPYYSRTINHDGVTYKTSQSPHTKRIWLDRNLGAREVATSITSSEAYGNKYTFEQAQQSCPVDFKLPSEDELRAETLDANIKSYGVIAASTIKHNFLKLTLAGHIVGNSNSIKDAGYYGSYWTTPGNKPLVLIPSSEEGNAFTNVNLSSLGRISARCIAAAPIITISVSIPITARVGTAITDIAIISTGGAAARYSIAPRIMNGLSFSTATGTISGTPIAVASEVNYTITAYNAYGTANVLITVVVDNSLGNEYFGKTNIFVFPNPTGSILNITVAEKTEYKLLNIRGQILKKGVLSIGESKINISSFAKGVYFLNLKTSKGSFTEKVTRD